MVKEPKNSEMKGAKKSFKVVSKEMLQKLQLKEVLEKLKLKEIFEKSNEKIKKSLGNINTDGIKSSIKKTPEKLKNFPKSAKVFREKSIKFRENFEISNNLKQRIVTAAILIPFVIILLYSSVFLFNGLVLLIVVLLL